MNVESNSILDKVLTKVGFVKYKGLSHESWSLNKTFANDNFISIKFTPSDMSDNYSTFEIDWNLILSDGHQIFMNSNPITVLSEAYEHFEDREDTYDIFLILEEAVERISLGCCKIM